MLFPAWAALGLVGLEYIAFSVAFDSQSFTDRHDAWLVADHLPWLGVLVGSSVIGSAVFALGRPHVRPFLIARPLDGRAATLLACHVALIMALWGLSVRIFAPTGPPGGSPFAWLVIWSVVGVASVWVAMAAAIPPRNRQWAAGTTGPSLVAGVAIGVGAWIVGQSSALLWWPLGPMTLRAVDLALNALLADTVSDPARALIGTERFPIIVAPVCSGFEGVGLMTVFIGSYLILARGRLRFPQALALLPIGIATAWAANVLRLVMLVLVGTFVSEEIAAGGFHAKAGWLFFCVLSLSLVLLVPRLRFFSQETSDADLRNPSAAYLLPFLALVAVSLLTGLVTKHVDMWYGLRILATIGVLLSFRRVYAFTWGWSWQAVGIGLVAAIAFIALAPRPDPQASQAWQAEWVSLSAWGRASWLSVRAAGSVLVVPIAEELAFRGYLLRRLVSPDFTQVAPRHFSLWALLASSAAFGAVHGGFVGGTIAGLLFGLAQIRGGSIMHAGLAHVVSNATVAVYVVGREQWWLWI